ncbi:ROK family protein [Cellulomonas sp. zg-ZUI199]|uniref:ROK family protein n=1 Tax=Cellulomonas wangleii TaxID=2816956 RepID=A0ABX8D2A1_9CELL|nr:ROK family protein [Cellulomonas wangleii]MBO0925500.1 ROK family protein [Cellulomonas wangleii]QVI61030.1 ROK family protein [Cellulomonas wangleii]
MSKDAKHEDTKHGHAKHEDTKHGHPKHDDPPVRTAFGIDIGGSGIKGAPVDLRTGEFAADRVRIPTPQPATPQAVARTVAEVVDSFHLDHDVPIGVTFPAVILHGVAQSAANVDDSWIGTDVAATVGGATGRPVVAVNDADAAGYAEVVYGAARDVPGVVLVVTLGTGIGSALVVDGVLVPNTELGHLEIDGYDAESRASDAARDREGLSFEQWAKRLQRYFSVVEDLFWPDLIVVGGGVSKKHQQFLPLLDLRTPIVPAGLRNAAGIVGAARLAAAQRR